MTLLPAIHHTWVISRNSVSLSGRLLNLRVVWEGVGSKGSLYSPCVVRGNPPTIPVPLGGALAALCTLLPFRTPRDPVLRSPLSRLPPVAFNYLLSAFHPLPKKTGWKPPLIHPTGPNETKSLSGESF